MCGGRLPYCYVLKTFIHILIIVLLQIICFQHYAFAQDTVYFAKPEKPAKQKFSPDPLKATMLAVAFPGAGQIYNRKYWKVPVAYGLLGAALYFVGFNSSNYVTYMKAYQDFTDDIPETNSYLKIKGLGELDPAQYDRELNPRGYSHYKDALLGAVDDYKRYRDLSYILTGLWYIASILDANVDASLFNYDVSNNLDIAVMPVQTARPGSHLGAGVNVGLMFNF